MRPDPHSDGASESCDHLPPKRWRIDDRGRYYCDGDCRSWGLGVCTCGLAHHLMLSQNRSLDGMSVKVRAQGERTMQYLVEHRPVPRPETCSHGRDLDEPGRCHECASDLEELVRRLEETP